MDADCWRHILLSKRFRESSSNFLAKVAKKLTTEDSRTWSGLWGSNSCYLYHFWRLIYRRSPTGWCSQYVYFCKSRSISIIWAAIAKYVKNDYIIISHMFVIRDFEISSLKCETQGYPTTIVIYAITIIPFVSIINWSLSFDTW